LLQYTLCVSYVLTAIHFLLKTKNKLTANLRSLRSLAISASDKATQRTQSSAEFAKREPQL